MDAILEVPVPTSASQLPSFLGMTIYYMQFLPDYSITSLLRQRLKEAATWDWTPACQAAIEELKRLLGTSLTMFHFHLRAPRW